MMKPRHANPAIPCLTVTIPEAAAMLGVGVSSVRKLIADKRLQALPVGTRLVIPLAALQRLLGTQ
jgi:excisionase family DNA binding protein